MYQFRKRMMKIALNLEKKELQKEYIFSDFSSVSA